MSSFKILITLTLVIFGLFFFTASAFAATYYVSTSGDDANPGTQAEPFRHIQKAADTAQAGDTVYIRGGTYNERIVLPKSGGSGAYITFQNAPGETPVLSGIGLGFGTMINAANKSYIIVRGLEISNYYGEGIAFHGAMSHIQILDNYLHDQFQLEYGGAHAILVTSVDYPHVYEATDIVISGNRLDNILTHGTLLQNGNEALTVAFSVDRVLISDNIVTNVSDIGINVIGQSQQLANEFLGIEDAPASPWVRNFIIKGNTVGYSGNATNLYSAGIYVNNCRYGVVEDNTVYSASGPGIAIAGEDTYMGSSYITTRRNYVYNNVNSILVGSMYWTGYGDHLRTVHNTATFYSGEWQGGWLLANVADSVMLNNIVHAPTANTYIIGSATDNSGDPVMDYNNYYWGGSGGPYIHYYGDIYTSFSAYKTATGKDVHSIITDPELVDVSTGKWDVPADLRIRETSDAIDAGTNLTTVGSANGTGTSVVVADSAYFSDGYGLPGISGDSIMIGTDKVTIIDVNYSTNTLTFTPSITWANGEGVNYTFNGSAPDMGAYESAVGGIPADTTAPAAPANVRMQ